MHQTNQMLDHLSSVRPNYEAHPSIQGIERKLSSLLECTFPKNGSKNNHNHNMKCPHGVFQNNIDLHLVQPALFRMAVMAHNLKAFQFSMMQHTDELEKRTKMLQNVLQDRAS